MAVGSVRDRAGKLAFAKELARVQGYTGGDIEWFVQVWELLCDARWVRLFCLPSPRFPVVLLRACRNQEQLCRPCGALLPPPKLHNQRPSPATLVACACRAPP